MGDAVHEYTAHQTLLQTATLVSGQCYRIQDLLLRAQCNAHWEGEEKRGLHISTATPSLALHKSLRRIVQYEEIHILNTRFIEIDKTCSEK